MGIITKKQIICKFSSRPSQARLSPSTSNSQTRLKTSRPRSRTRKVFPQISKDSSSLESNSKTEEPSRTTTSRRNPLSILSSDSEVVCKSLSRPSPERPSPLMSNNLTPSKTSRLRSRTKKVFPQTSKDSSSPESNSKTAAPFRTTTSRRSLLSTWSSDLEEVCKSSLRPLPERPSHSTLSNLTPSRT